MTKDSILSSVAHLRDTQNTTCDSGLPDSANTPLVAVFASLASHQGAHTSGPAVLAVSHLAAAAAFAILRARHAQFEFQYTEAEHLVILRASHAHFDFRYTEAEHVPLTLTRPGVQFGRTAANVC